MLGIALHVRLVSGPWRGFHVKQSVDTRQVEVSRPLTLSDKGPDISISKAAEGKLHYRGLTPGRGNPQGG